MSVIKFELTEQHIAIVQNVDMVLYFRWRNLIDKVLYEEDLYNEFGLILFGKPDGEFDPLSSVELDWSIDQKVQMDKIFEEFDTAHKIMLQTGTFSAGNYKTRHHDINWKKK